MRLSYNTKATITDYLVQGTIMKYQQDRALSNILMKIKDGGWSSLGDLGVFDRGLKSYFENEEYILNGKITSKAEKIIETKHLWKGMQGRFILSILKCQNQQYLIACKEYGKSPNMFEDCDDEIKLEGEYHDSEDGYRIDALDIKKMKGQSKDTKIKIEYDYDSRSIKYHVEGKTFDNSKYFSLIDYDLACNLLRFTLQDYSDLKIKDHAITYNGDQSNPLTNEKINLAIDTGGYFKENRQSAPDLNAYEIFIYDARFTISSKSVAEELFYRYFEKKARSKYYARQDIDQEIEYFYKLFEKCAEFKTSNTKIHNKLVDFSKNTNKESYLRLSACLDLDPNEMIEPHITETKDLSTSSKSMKEIVKDIFNEFENIESITLITKFAYVNQSISKNIKIFSDAINNQYDINLTVITAELTRNTGIASKEEFNSLQKYPSINFIKKDENTIKEIHDRYYRVKYRKNAIGWIKMSGELDAIHFNTDNANMDTIGDIREMTLSYVQSTGIPVSVQKIMDVD